MDDQLLALSTYIAIFHRQFQRDMNQLLVSSRLPINITEFYLLVLLSETKPMTQGEAAKMIAVDEGLMTRMVRHLVELGFASKTLDKEDRRKKFVLLTSEGQKLVNRAIFELHDWWDGIKPQMTEEEISQALALISRITPGSHDILSRD